LIFDTQRLLTFAWLVISNSSRPSIHVSITGLLRETKVLVLVLAIKVLVLVLVLDTKVLVLVLVLVTKVLVNITDCSTSCCIRQRPK